MFDFQQKRKLRTVMTSRVTQGILLFLSCLVLLSVIDRYQIARDMSDRRTAIESEIEALETRKQTLDKEVDYLLSERGAEAEMRRQFDMAREGEQVILIVDDPKKSENSATNTSEIIPEEPVRAWYHFW